MGQCIKLYTDYTSKFTIFARNFRDAIGVMNNCPSIRSQQYNPTIYLPSALTQIVYSLKYEEHPDIRYECHDLITFDGGKVQAWICTYPPVKGPVKKVIVINHGHTFGAGAKYAKLLCLECHKNGF